MATGHIFKTHTGSGAPPLRNVAGDLIAVLDWALNVAAGTHWQKVFSGTNKAVYRATTGHRYYLRVDDTSGSLAYVRGYESMTDVDTGTNPFPTLAQRGSTGFFLHKANSATARAYTVVGDSRFFTVVSNANSGHVAAHLEFGEASPFDAADSFSTCIRACVSTSQGNGNGGSIFGYALENASSWESCYWARSISGVNPSSNGGHQVGLLNQGGRLDLASVPVFNACRLWDFQGASSATSGYARAVSPYVYHMPYSVDAGIWPVGTVQTIGTSSFQAWVGYSSGPYALIRTSNDEPGRV